MELLTPAQTLAFMLEKNVAMAASAQSSRQRATTDLKTRIVVHVHTQCKTRKSETILVNILWMEFVKTAVPRDRTVPEQVYFTPMAKENESVFADMRLILTIAANAFSRLSGLSLTHSEAVKLPPTPSRLHFHPTLHHLRLPPDSSRATIAAQLPPIRSSAPMVVRGLTFVISEEVPWDSNAIMANNAKRAAHVFK